MPHNLPEVWRRIEVVLRRHDLPTASTLAPPASAGQLAGLQAAIGLTLPQDLAESLAVHNGQDDPTGCHSFTESAILLGTREIAKLWQMVGEIDRETRETVDEPVPSGADPGWWKPTLIPFAEVGGDMLCVDVDASLGERAGEVVWHVHDSEILRGVAPSYGAWLEGIASRLETGHFRIDEDGRLRADPWAQ